MKKINVLDKHIAQLIAAGEVVERPASALKELIENSIDAGATRIIVEIRNGGVKLIKVSDNGSGIYRDDVKNAFLRHATSKLNKAEDLNNISSLGFRGEALASICAVSRTEVITKSKEELSGTQFFIDAGTPGNISDIGCSDGTTIIIKDLFYNTPARMKFLKKDVAEANACAGVIDKLALSHPEISFKFIREGKEALFTPGDGKISSAIYSVYGKDFFEGMTSVEYELSGIKVSGFVSKPSAAKSSRSMQNFFINGRYIKSQVGSSALEEAFKNSIMVGKFPYCVLYVDISPDFVDVNVHPSKTEVKFINEKTIFEAIYYGVKSALMNSNSRGIALNTGSESLLPDAQLRDSADFSRNVQKKVSVSTSNLHSDLFTKENSVNSDFLNSFFDRVKEKNIVIENYNTSQSTENINADSLLRNSESKNSPISCDREPNIQIGSLFNSSEEKNVKIIGEAFNCYILMECESELVLVDKHAAHERIIFEKLKETEGNGESQSLLEPIIVTMNKEEYSAILENLELIARAGYFVENFGSGTIIVRSIPMHILIEDVPNSLVEIANYIINNKKSIDTQKLDWLYHNIACRSAIKGGKSSTEKEISALIKKLIENPNIQHCPHGRPIYVTLTQRFIEKQFGRV